MNNLVIIAVYALFFGGLWFLLIRPQKKEQKRVQLMLSELEVGDTIKVISGAWADTVAEIKAINMQKQSVTIDVDIFGRATSVEIGFLEVQKLS